MNVDCLWVEKNLEALFSDRLTDDESRLARSHIEMCAACRKETMALNAIDPLVKNLFRRELAAARRPRAIHRGRVLGFSSAAVAAAALLLLLIARTPQLPPALGPVASVPEASAPASAAPGPAPVKIDETEDVQRTKPTAAPNVAADRKRQTAPAVTSNSPDLLVTDAAGYSHSLEEFRGRTVIVAVWDNDQTEGIANIERLYKANVANPKVRFIVVSNERLPKPPNTTFPSFYNQGSKLLGARPGEFVMLNESGLTELRGSLVKDIESLRKELSK